MDRYKGIAAVSIADGSTALFWHDLWNGRILAQDFPEMYSFTINANIEALARPQLTHNFNLPLTIQAHNQFTDLQHIIVDINLETNNDIWTYIWGSSNFSMPKAYKAIIGQRTVHPIFYWIWRSRCQSKHKVFFWLLVKDRLSTRDLLRRRQMNLDSCTCELCILQKRETVNHLFFQCNYARACWNQIGITYIPS